MQKIKSLLLAFILLFSVGQHSFAMLRTPFHQIESGEVLGSPLYKTTHQAQNAAKLVVAPVAQQCARDALKMAVGASIFLSAFSGFAHMYTGCVDHRAELTEPGKWLCSTPAAITIATCEATSGLYTLCQLSKFTFHAWQLLKILGNKLLNNKTRKNQRSDTPLCYFSVETDEGTNRPY